MPPLMTTKKAKQSRITMEPKNLSEISKIGKRKVELRVSESYYENPTKELQTKLFENIPLSHAVEIFVVWLNTNGS